MELALQSLLGVVAIPLLAFAICEDRSALDRRRLLVTILAGLGLQFTIALLLLKLPGSRTIFDAVGAVVTALQAATGEGMRMVFGYLAGGPTPFDSPRPAAQFILAFQALPLILVISALARLLYHWGVLQRVVGLFATLLRKSFGIGGPLGTVAAAKIFLGMVEAPLLVKPYLREMGRGALFAAMAVGMATVAGTVMALYATNPGACLAGSRRPRACRLAHERARRTHVGAPRRAGGLRGRACRCHHSARQSATLRHGCHRARHNRWAEAAG